MLDALEHTTVPPPPPPGSGLVWSYVWLVCKASDLLPVMKLRRTLTLPYQYRIVLQSAVSVGFDPGACRAPA